MVQREAKRGKFAGRLFFGGAVPVTPNALEFGRVAFKHLSATLLIDVILWIKAEREVG